jgi:glycosyltransferase involved in cell wall biosynthesis
MPLFYCALDVGIIINKETSFARYCFPQKFFEMLACELPMVVASIGDVKDIMSGCPQALFQTGDENELADAIRMQLHRPCRPDIEAVSWDRQAAVLAEYLDNNAGRQAGLDD